jgi:excisionase family DNA binding protein
MDKRAFASIDEIAEQEGDRIITVPQACDMLSVCRITLYKLIHAGDIPAFRLARGGRWKSRTQDLEEWLETNQAGGCDEEANCRLGAPGFRTRASSVARKPEATFITFPGQLFHPV